MFNFFSEPVQVEAINAFDEIQFCGLWYEIASVKGFFQTELKNVSIDIQWDQDTGIFQVENAGFNPSGERVVSNATLTPGSENPGKMTYVSPFLGGLLNQTQERHLVVLDELNYLYKVVSSPTGDEVCVISFHQVNRV
eukprot:TRINITY_DN2142_c0_g1_i3.p1 TRINITY_DN2142_c0_g1~~TRINITY_DN2142_c0_g1_i3.p1  ORF type:complete len:138 (+),score=23.32 TRINITY_DN2142_c0_g1_i3:172-585(+)